jgi:hypothetical protein
MEAKMLFVVCNEMWVLVIVSLSPYLFTFLGTNSMTSSCLLFCVKLGPDAVWLDKHYTKIHSASGSNIRPPPTPFLSLFVGCNKGFDALNALRMGSGNPDFDKRLWNDAITQQGQLSLHRDVCNEVTRPQFDLPLESQHILPSISASSPMLSQVHCIEPMPTTARGKVVNVEGTFLIPVISYSLSSLQPSISFNVHNKYSTPKSSA